MESISPEVLYDVYNYLLRLAMRKGCRLRDEQGREVLSVNLTMSYQALAGELHRSARHVTRALNHLTEQGVFAYRDKHFFRFHYNHAEKVIKAAHHDEVADLLMPTRSEGRGAERPDGLMTRAEWDQLMRNIATFANPKDSEPDAEHTLIALIRDHRRYRNLSKRGDPLY